MFIQHMARQPVSSCQLGPHITVEKTHAFEQMHTGGCHSNVCPSFCSIKRSVQVAGATCLCMSSSCHQPYLSECSQWRSGSHRRHVPAIMENFVAVQYESASHARHWGRQATGATPRQTAAPDPAACDWDAKQCCSDSVPRSWP